MIPPEKVVRETLSDTDPMSGRPAPPNGMIRRFRFYGKRNGYVYAAMSFIGRSSFRFWRNIAPLFTRKRIARWLATSGPRIVNLGGGANTSQAWLTADMDPRADVFVDLTKPLPFPAQSVDVVYLEEVIEHITEAECPALLTEVHRILKVGGALRLTTPCLDLYASQFDGSKVLEKKFNDIFYQHGHRAIYGKAGVRALLIAANFTGLRESSFRDIESAYGHFDTHALRVALSDSTTTQYWDAVKAG